MVDENTIKSIAWRLDRLMDEKGDWWLTHPELLAALYCLTVFFLLIVPLCVI